MSSATNSKRRQTCDPCRRAKIKCNKKTPICGKCLATGDLCGYGISRQGAWWRDRGTRKPSNHQIQDEEILDPFDSSNPDVSLAEYASVATLLSSQLLEKKNISTEQDHEYEMDIESLYLQGNYNLQDFDIPSQATPSSAEMTPKRQVVDGVGSALTLGDINESLLSTNQAAGLHEFPFFLDRHLDDRQSQYQEPRTRKAIPQEIDLDKDLDENQSSCLCYSTVLQALQALEDSFPLAHVGHQSPSSAEVATVMQHNERTLQCCLTVIRCQSCREDQGRSPMVLLLTLIGREILLTGEWARRSLNQPTSNSAYPQPPASERNLRIEVAQVGTRRLSEMVFGLRQICESLSCDFTRLAHNVLLESCMINLRNASARLTLEANRDTARRR